MRRNYRPWSEADVALLMEHYPNTRTDDLARMLGRDASSVHHKAHGLGIKKSAEFYSRHHAGRMQRGRNDPRIIATQFKPGAVPWNKGKTYVAGGRSAQTRFKPGRAPQDAHNYRPIGSLRITKGTLERKVHDDPSVFPARRWMPVARLVWEAAHGPITPGHIVVFKPGQATVVEAEITPDKLECISRAEHARRNHPRQLSPEIGRLVQLKGQITRQINRLAREQKEHNT